MSPQSSLPFLPILPDLKQYVFCTRALSTVATKSFVNTEYKLFISQEYWIFLWQGQTENESIEYDLICQIAIIY